MTLSSSRGMTEASEWCWTTWHAGFTSRVDSGNTTPHADSPPNWDLYVCRLVRQERMDKYRGLHRSHGVLQYLLANPESQNSEAKSLDCIMLQGALRGPC